MMCVLPFGLEFSSLLLHIGRFLAVIGVPVAFISCLLGCALRDIRERRIPNRMIAIMVSLWILGQIILGALSGDGVSVLAVSLGRMVSAGVVVAVLLAFTMAYERLTGRFGLGGGDIKLIGVIALFAGWEATILCLAIACAVSLLYAIACKGRDAGIPFAPCLMCGTLGGLLVL